MNYNPYVPPQAGVPQAPATQQASAPQPWEIGEVLSSAWEIYKANWGVFTGAFVVMLICTTGPGMMVNIAVATTQALSPGHPPDPMSGASLGAGILDQAISAFFTIGFTRLALAGARGQAVQFATLFSGGPRFFAYVGAFLLMVFALVFGFLLLIVPCFILACALWATPFFIADTDLGPIESLKASWEATKGQRLAIFLFALVGGLLQCAGLIACCVGMLVTLPLFLIAQAIVFLRITGRGAAALPPPMGGYGGPPPGYGGPPPGYGGPPPGYGGPPPGGPPGGYGPPGGGYGGPPPGAPPGGYGPPGGGYPPR